MRQIKDSRIHILLWSIDSKNLYLDLEDSTNSITKQNTPDSLMHWMMTWKILSGKTKFNVKDMGNPKLKESWDISKIAGLTKETNTFRVDRSTLAILISNNIKENINYYCFYMEHTMRAKIPFLNNVRFILEEKLYNLFSISEACCIQNYCFQ